MRSLLDILIISVPAPVGTITAIEVVVAESTTAVTEPKRTLLPAATGLKPVPVILTVAPKGPEAGLKVCITGGATQVKPAKEELPPGADKVTEPEAPAAITTMELSFELFVNDCTGTPPMVIPLIFTNEVPLIVNTVPCVPLKGVKRVMVGLTEYPAKVAVPLGVVTERDPPPPEGAVACINVGDTTVNELAGIPANSTELVFVKPFPEMLTNVPSDAEVGKNELIVGGPKKVNPLFVP